jgi:hypothetical protein
MKSKHKTEEQPVHLINESAKPRQAIEDLAARKTGRRLSEFISNVNSFEHKGGFFMCDNNK